MVACGKYISVLLHVFTVGIKEYFTSVKIKDGWSSRPNL